jgi:hypothetical protein
MAGKAKQLFLTPSSRTEGRSDATHSIFFKEVATQQPTRHRCHRHRHVASKNFINTIGWIDWSWSRSIGPLIFHFHWLVLVVAE